MNKIFNLVIVDPQYDFVDVHGSLHVDGAGAAMHSICEYIKKYHGLIRNCVITMDNHPANHISFEQWSVHCVAGTQGSEICPEIIHALNRHKDIEVHIVKKGESSDTEEYSAFKCESLIPALDPKYPVVVCGVAGDVCVKHTIFDLINLHNMTVYAFINGIASINSTEFHGFLDELSIPKITL